MSGGESLLGSVILPRCRSHLRTIVSREDLRGPGLALGLKIASSALNLLMLALLARSMSTGQFGLFAFWFNVLLFLAVLAGLGQEKLILRQWGEYHARELWGLARGALRFGTRLTVLGTLAGAGAVACIGWLSGSELPLTVATTAFIVALTLFIYTAHLNRAVIGILKGDVHELTWRAVVIAGSGAAIALGTELSAAQVFGLATLGLGIGTAAQFAWLSRHLPPVVRAATLQTEIRAWWARSFKMALGSNLESAAQYLEVVVVGLVLSPAAAGIYFVCSRLANVFLMISGGLDSYTMRQIPRQYYTEGRHAVQETLRRLALITAIPISVGLVGIVLFGPLILEVFGDTFTLAYPVLVALALAAAASAAAGPAMPVLVQTGHEGIYSVLLAVTVTLRLGGLAVFASLYGLVGAAIASAVSAVLGAVVLNIACRRRAGLDPAVTMFLPGRGP